MRTAILIIVIAMDAELRCEVQSALGHVAPSALKQFAEIPPAFECAGSIFRIIVDRLRGSYLFYNTKRQTNAKATEEIAKGVREYSPELEQALHRLLTDDFYKRLLASCLTSVSEERAESVPAKKKAGSAKEPVQNKPSTTLELTKKK